MLVIRDAWTNEDAWRNESVGWSGFVLWFAAIDTAGQWWWLIAHISRELGFMCACILKVNGREQIVQEMDDDEGDGWAPIDPSDALDRVRVEFDRVHGAPWTEVYPDHYRLVCDEYARFWDTVQRLREPEHYER